MIPACPEPDTAWYEVATRRCSLAAAAIQHHGKPRADNVEVLAVIEHQPAVPVPHVVEFRVDVFDTGDQAVAQLEFGSAADRKAHIGAGGRVTPSLIRQFMQTEGIVGAEPAPYRRGRCLIGQELKVLGLVQCQQKR